MRLALIALGSAALLGTPSAAQEAVWVDVSSLAEPPPVVVTAELPFPGSTRAPGAPDPLDPSALADLHARQGVTATALSSQLLQATNSGNSIRANQIRSGDISITSNAFAGFGGVGNFVMNTGNNNNLQGAVTINIVTTAPTP